MKSIIYINGNFYNKEEARVSVLDRGFLFGDSVYEVIRVYNKNFPFLMNEHLDRLAASADLLGFEIPFTKEEIKNAITEGVSKLDNKETYVRIIVTRGACDYITLAFDNAEEPSLAIIFNEYRPYDEWRYTDGIDLCTVNIRRNPIKSFNPAIKSGNYLNNMLAYNEAVKKGFFDAVILNPDGFLTEISTSNLFFVKDKEICTPHQGSGILDGITRKFILAFCKKHKIEVKEGFFREEDLYEASECFISSTLKEIMPVKRFNDKEFSSVPGEITKKLMGLFKEEIEAINPN